VANTRQNSNTKVNPLKEKQITCYRCVGEHKAPDCPEDKEKLFCAKCSTKGHLEGVCRRKQVSSAVKHVDDYIYDGEYVDEDVFPIYRVEEFDYDSEEPIHITVSLHGKPFVFEFDTGARRTVISQTDVETFKLPSSTIRLIKLWLKPYSEDCLPIKVTGIVTTDVIYDGTKKQLTYYVVPGKQPPLFGRTWMRAFGLKLTRKEEDVVHKLSEGPSNVREILQRYPEVLDSEVGEIKNYECDIKLRPDAKPIFCKARAVPFTVRKKLDIEYDRLVKKGLFEWVDTSEWATPVVTVVKPDSIRICGDYSVIINSQTEVIKHSRV